MKRCKYYQIIILIVIVSTIIIANTTLMMGNNHITLARNPNLKIVKQHDRGNIIMNGRFYNDSTITRAPLWSVIKWKLTKNPQKKEKQNCHFKLKVVSITFFNGRSNKIIWFGHSSFYIAINGVQLLIDPCFGDLATSKRHVNLPCAIDSLTDIDYILVSHDHRDHLDKKTIEKIIVRNSSLEILAPLGAKRILKRCNVQEAGWWQEYLTKHDNMRIIFLPARHWGRRGLNDYNKVLWGSFIIITPQYKIFFAGDTAYNRNMFQEIHSLFGDIDLCLLLIGAYAPAWLMSEEHMNPEEALAAFYDLGGKFLIPMHYGTFDLSDEPMGEPLHRLKSAAAKNGRDSQVKELAVGQEYILN